MKTCSKIKIDQLKNQEKYKRQLPLEYKKFKILNSLYILLTNETIN